jgi:hypothetical protein
MGYGFSGTFTFTFTQAPAGIRDGAAALASVKRPWQAGNAATTTAFT